jgi:hypothetical protein
VSHAGEAPLRLVSTSPLLHSEPDRATGSRYHGPCPRVLPLKNNLESDKSYKHYIEPLELVVNCTAIPLRLEKLQQGLSVLKNNYL